MCIILEMDLSLWQFIESHVFNNNVAGDRRRFQMNFVNIKIFFISTPLQFIRNGQIDNAAFALGNGSVPMRKHAIPHANDDYYEVSRAPSQYKDRLIYVWRFPC